MTTLWFHSSDKDTTKGVALVAHGLNLNPVKMEAIISILNEIGIDALLVSLQGHGEGFFDENKRGCEKRRMESFKTVNQSVWTAEFKEAYYELDKRAKDKNCPKYFVGYSLGGLMGCDLLLNEPDCFSKMYLLAPAITPHTIRVPFLRLFFLFSSAVIPSLSPKHYRSNRGTPIAAYRALLEKVTSFKSRISPNLNIPTIVFLDKNDELVAFGKLKKLVKNYNLNHWKIHEIKRVPSEMKYSFHHLIIDQESSGSKTWKALTDSIKSHFLDSLS